MRAVGVLMGEGEIGKGNGDLGAPWTTAAPGKERESLGLDARSMLGVQAAVNSRAMRHFLFLEAM